MLLNTQSTVVLSTALFAVSSVAKDGFKVLPRGSADGTLVACYSAAPGYGSSQSYTYQSSGWCLDKCYAANSAAFALTGGSTCLCGSTLPPDSDKVDSSKCNKPCTGWPSDMCGGSDYYSIYTTGYEDDVPTYSEHTSTTTTKSSSQSTSTQSDSDTDSASTAVSSTAPQQTTEVISTAQSSASASTEAKTKSSHNTAAIAAGVVIGVVGFAALCGAAFFFWRSKQNKTNPAFGGGAAGGYGRDSNPPSMSDSRFDGDYMAQRRQSNGSIDDDHDFSRRILQVTNPDR
ncbi:uncharacterized protein N7511_002087 [Penicillium nucicola]|uniref:uncharacterized protein n=1 Tax=Penicillium nucicola TaxID=1850975 RepID=UPI002545BCD2|nr:uncharacterized protein N7511_002087 [Penicillium nucicola]KAJ5770036.1 hypothetical protein N7511_002087 [Penicillium nucicola]